jgi:putative acyl-CoA dehydrogenase
VQALVLADLVLEWAGAAHLAFRLARTLDNRGDVSERLLGRILTLVSKYWNFKRAPLVAEEAIECIAATATSRSTRCRVTTGRRRSTRSGRAPTT